MRIVTFRNELMCGLFLSPSYQSIESEQMSWGDQFFNDDDSVYDWRGEDQWWHQPLLDMKTNEWKIVFWKEEKEEYKKIQSEMMTPYSKSSITRTSIKIRIPSIIWLPWISLINLYNTAILLFEVLDLFQLLGSTFSWLKNWGLAVVECYSKRWHNLRFVV